jgi:hypothetical protein
LLPNKRTLAENYDIIAWQLRIFIGGTFNMAFIYIFLAYFASNISPTGQLISLSTSYWAPFAVLFILVVFSPFLMSLILSKTYPNIQIVSPFWLALVSFVEILITGIGVGSLPNLGTLILVDLLYLATGYVEDGLTPKLLGIAVEKEQIYFEHLHIIAYIDDVLKQLTIPVIKNRLRLSNVIEGDATQGYILKTRKKRGENCAYKLSLARNEENKKATELKIVYFEKGRYVLTSSPDFLEWMREISDYLQDVLSRPDRDLHFAVTPIVRLTNQAQDSLIDSVMSDMEGYVAKYKRFSLSERIGLIAFVAILGSTATMFFVGRESYALVLGVIDALLAIYEVRDILNRRSRR